MKSTPLSFDSYPPDFRAQYRALGYWLPENFGEFVSARCHEHSERLAVVGQNSHGHDERWSYGDLDDKSTDAARWLRGLGVEAFDRVVIALPNIVEFVSILTGLFKIGAIPVLALPSHREKELIEFCTTSDAVALVVSGGEGGANYIGIYNNVSCTIRARGGNPPFLVDVKAWENSDRHLGPICTSRIDSEQLGLLQLSGGTSGVSKLIPRMAADYLYSVRASADICEITHESVMLVCLPVAHNFPLSSPGILGILHVGGTVVLARDPSPGTAFRLIEQERVTIVSLVPPLAQAWLSFAKRRFVNCNSLETIQVGGAKLNVSSAEELQLYFKARLQQVYGMAEGLVCYTRKDDTNSVLVNTQGTPISAHDEILIIGEDGKEVPKGEAGALIVRGPYTIRGYYGIDIGVSSGAFTNEGYYRTGDLVRRVGANIVVSGRSTDVINCAGEKISASEVEGILVKHSAVMDAVVVGLPDDILGERLCAVLKLEHGSNRPAEIRSFLREAGLASYKIPREYVCMENFPVTYIGKHNRNVLREALIHQIESNRRKVLGNSESN